MELIFFPIAGIVLCFGFRMRIMLITHRCFSCCYAVLTQSQGLFCFLYRPGSEGDGVHERLGGGTAGTSGLEWPEGYSIPYDIMLNI